jgi:hypothetical protein
MPTNAPNEEAAAATPAAHQAEMVASSPEPIQISAETPIGLLDAAVIALVAAAALWYLYSIFWKRRGACGGCAKGKGDGSCAVGRATAAAADPLGKAANCSEAPPEVGYPVDRIGHRAR